MYIFILTDIYTEWFGEGSGQIILDDVECTGNEISLSQCRHNDFYCHNCTHFKDIGVQCFAGIQCLKLVYICVYYIYIILCTQNHVAVMEMCD